MIDKFKQFENYKKNEEFRNKKGYRPKFKSGYILVSFTDVDKTSKTKFKRTYTFDTDFLKEFAKEIGAELMHDDKEKYKPSIIDDYWVLFKVPQGKEIETLERVEELNKKYEFINDSDIYDVKSEDIKKEFDNLSDILKDLSIESGSTSDKELSDSINYIINKLNVIKTKYNV